MLKRIIARLDIKGPNLIKGIHLEGLRVLGDPHQFAVNYYQSGIDEIILMDSVASLYGRNQLSDVVRSIAKEVFVPITVGGGIRSELDVYNALKNGADKVAINTAIVENPGLISTIIKSFGSQCLVLSIEAKKVSADRFEVYVNNGREKTGLEVCEWVKHAVDLGIGEILLTSIDKEGTKKGFDIPLIKKISQLAKVPFIVCGGMWRYEDSLELIKQAEVDGLVMAGALHYNNIDIRGIKNYLSRNGVSVRKILE